MISEKKSPDRNAEATNRNIKKNTPKKKISSVKRVVLLWNKYNLKRHRFLIHNTGHKKTSLPAYIILEYLTLKKLWIKFTSMIAYNHLYLYICSFSENIALNKAAYYVTHDGLRKDANVVVDGRKLYNDGQCLSIPGGSELSIDLGELLSIHHLTAHLNILSEFFRLYSMYIPVFFSVPYFCLVVLFLLVTMSTVSSAERKISVLLQRRCRHERIRS